MDDLELACSEKRYRRIVEYVVLLTSFPFEEQSKKQKMFTFSQYSHMESCYKCYTTYNFLTSFFKKLEDFEPENNFFSSAQLRNLKNNEVYLESILK